MPMPTADHLSSLLFCMHHKRFHLASQMFGNTAAAEEGSRPVTPGHASPHAYHGSLIDHGTGLLIARALCQLLDGQSTEL